MLLSQLHGWNPRAMRMEQRSRVLRAHMPGLSVHHMMAETRGVQTGIRQ